MVSLDFSPEGLYKTLEQPLPGLELSTVVWTILFGIVCVIPGISNKSFDFRVSGSKRPPACLRPCAWTGDASP